MKKNTAKGFTSAVVEKLSMFVGSIVANLKKDK